MSPTSKMLSEGSQFLYSVFLETGLDDKVGVAMFVKSCNTRYQNVVRV